MFEGHHRGLRSHLSHLRDSTLRPPAQDPQARRTQMAAIAESLNALRCFAETHFADEEKLMEDVGFPGHARHSRQHNDFLGWLDDLEKTLLQESDGLRGESLATAMIDWWESHAVDHDGELAEFLCRGGV